MRVGGGNAAAQSMMTKQRTESRGAHGLSAAAAFQGNKQRGRVSQRSFQVEIFPEDLHNILGQGQDAFLVAFGEHSRLQLIPLERVKLFGSRIHTIRCTDGSTSSSRTATAGEAIASIFTTRPADCGRSLPAGPTWSRM